MFQDAALLAVCHVLARGLVVRPVGAVAEILVRQSAQAL